MRRVFVLGDSTVTDQTADARSYWMHVRRALLRQKIDRIGLGGYPHLLRGFPDFVAYIADIADEFRAIRALHEAGSVYTLPLTVAVLHSWGGLRPWTLSGHFHETYMHTLIHINEALAGLPVDVRFIDFEDVRNGALAGVDVVINAGRAGTAWSGGEAWNDAALVAALNRWVCEGGVFLGVEEPSAAPGHGDTFRMARILGVDEDRGARVCHGRWTAEPQPVEGLIPAGAHVPVPLRLAGNLYLTDADTRVLAMESGVPLIASHACGRGRGVYLAGFSYSCENARLLMNLLLWATGRPLTCDALASDAAVECAWFPEKKTLVVINNAEEPRTATIKIGEKSVTQTLEACETRFASL